MHDDKALRLSRLGEAARHQVRLKFFIDFVRDDRRRLPDSAVAHLIALFSNDTFNEMHRAFVIGTRARCDLLKIGFAAPVLLKQPPDRSVGRRALASHRQAASEGIPFVEQCIQGGSAAAIAIVTACNTVVGAKRFILNRASEFAVARGDVEVETSRAVRQVLRNDGNRTVMVTNPRRDRAAPRSRAAASLGRDDPSTITADFLRQRTAEGTPSLRA